MFFYNAYGLSIHSSISFPELNAGCSGKDISINWGNFKTSNKLDSKLDFDDGYQIQVSDKVVYIFLEDYNICRISNGCEILVNPNTGIDESILKALILCPALSILLHQRGNLVLHAGAVNINDSAVAFLGNNGAGKSTSMLAFNKKGYPIITDDSLCLKFENGKPIVSPSYSRLKIRPDVITHMYGNSCSLPKTHIYSEKYSYFTEDNFSNNQLILKNLYYIEKGDELSINTLNPIDSLIRLVKSSYCYSIFNKEELAENLMTCAKIVNLLPVKLLKIPHSLDNIPELIRIIENDN